MNLIFKISKLLLSLCKRSVKLSFRLVSPTFWLDLMYLLALSDPSVLFCSFAKQTQRDFRMEEDQTAVSLRSVSVTYGKGKHRTVALNNISLDIPRGKIYALIGPSGCGKTTLVHCCVGFTTPKSGSIKIFGKAPGHPECGAPGSRVGYMPQELALYPDFTIGETMMFFGRLYGVPLTEIIARTHELITFLRLPPKSRLICQLSGGQQRRVSFAVALVHKPWLIAVDEPTVGLDPVLRKNIWDYLSTLTKQQGMTVIITTHYIEEAREADSVCFIRSGHLLTSGKPAELMNRFGAPSLEDIFLKLCLHEDGEETLRVTSKRNENGHEPLLANGTNRTEVVYCPDAPNGNGHVIQICKTKETAPLRHRSTKIARVSAMCWKNVLRLKRNLAIVIFQYLTPALCIILFCTCFGRDPHDINVAVSNMDPTGALSETFLHSIDNTSLRQINYDTMEEAMYSLHSGHSWAVIHLERGFSKAVKDRYFYLGSIDEDKFNRSMVKVYIDWTNHILATHIQKTLFDAILTFGERCSVQEGKEFSVMSKSIIQIQKPPFGEKKQTLTEFMTPGNILVFLFFSAAASTALVFVMERKEGMLRRAIIAGVHPHEFLTSHLLQQIFILIGQIVIMLCFTFFVFNIQNRGSYTAVCLLILLQGISGMSYGLFISAISCEESHAFIILMGSLLPNFLVSGFIWPLETMPNIIMAVGHWLPNARAIESLRFIMYRGWDVFDHSEVWLGFAVTIGWILFFQIAALQIFKRTNKL